MTTDKSSEREAFEAWAATVMLNLKRLYAGYFHEATAFAWLAWQARAALPQQAQDAPCNEVFEALGLDPDHYITEGGAINVPKLRATIKHPSDYLPPDHWMNAATSPQTSVAGSPTLGADGAPKEPIPTKVTDTDLRRGFLIRLSQRQITEKPEQHACSLCGVKGWHKCAVADAAIAKGEHCG